MKNWRKSMLTAYSRFHEVAEDLEDLRENFPNLVAYDICKVAENTKGTFAWRWGVPSEIRETINGINAWGIRLHEWAVWLKLLQEYEDKELWELEGHFVEPLTFYCLYQPRAVAERLLEVAENTIHQANLKIDPTTSDRLDQDTLKPGQRLSMKSRRKQLDRLGAKWLSYPQFIKQWRQIDTKSYRALTKNYRNLSSHSIAPRFRLGDTRRTSRKIVPAFRMEEQPNGSYLDVEIKGKNFVSYGFGAVIPIEFNTAYEANNKEYELVLIAMERFCRLIVEMCSAMNEKSA